MYTDETNSTYCKEKNVLNKKFNCSSCKQTFTRKYHLVRHLYQTGCDGRKKLKFTCQVCNYVFSRKDNLQEHLRNHIKKYSSQNIHTCGICKKDFDKKSRLALHMRSHHKKEHFICNICSKSLKSKKGLIVHIRGHTGEKPFTCLQCNKSFSSKEILNRHSKTHLIDKPHSCKECGKSFIQLIQLRNHMFYHTGENGFTCKYCGVVFNRKSKVTMHQRFVHEGESKIKCPHDNCPKTFMDKGVFKRHLLIHTDEKNYKCMECGKCFRTSVLLAKHKRTHFNEIPRKCFICHRAFIRADCLLRHMRNKHPNLYQTLRITAYKNKVLKLPQSSLSFISNIKKLLPLLIDETTLKLFDWPNCSVDKVIEIAIEKLGCSPVASKNTRIQNLRENIKLLLLLMIKDHSVKDTIKISSIDEIIMQILGKF